MTPYYSEGGVTIWHGDCREVLPSLPRKSIDAVITDPPFFMPAMHYQSRVTWQRSWSDTSVLAAFWAVVCDAVVRLLRSTGHMLAFCNGDSYPVFYPEMYRRFDYLKSLVWDKGHVGLGRVWRNQHELIVAARWDTSEFVEDGQLRADVLRFTATPSTDRLHPVEKPIDLLMALMLPTMPAGGTVLDPFMGAGTTLKAARQGGYNAVGVEGEERYCEIAAKRLAQGVFDFNGATSTRPTVDVAAPMLGGDEG